MRQDYITKVRYLAQNLGHAVLNPQKDWENKWLGDLDDGEACPGCHTSLMIAKPDRNYVECAVCGRKGYLTLDQEGKIKYSWPEDNRNRRNGAALELVQKSNARSR